MAHQEAGCGGERAFLAVQVGACAIGQHVLWHELRLADFTMHGAARRGRKLAGANQLQGGIKLLGEVFGAAAVIGQGGHGRQRVLVSGETAEGCFHAPNGNQWACRHTIFLFNRCKERRIGSLHLAALGHDGGGTALVHEFAQAKLEGVLVAVCLDGGRGIAGVHQG